MNYKYSDEGGFVLIVTMIVLAILSILVLNGVRGTVLNERMAGNYMDRALAQQAAEQALRDAQALLLANAQGVGGAPLCSDGCAVPTAGLPTATTTTTLAPPSSWGSTQQQRARPIPVVTGQATSASYVVDLLADTALPTSPKNLLSASCKAYSIMGKGVGHDTRTNVVLQTVAYICPI